VGRHTQGHARVGGWRRATPSRPLLPPPDNSHTARAGGIKGDKAPNPRPTTQAYDKVWMGMGAPGPRSGFQAPRGHPPPRPHRGCTVPASGSGIGCHHRPMPPKCTVRHTRPSRYWYTWRICTCATLRVGEGPSSTSPNHPQQVSRKASPHRHLPTKNADSPTTSTHTHCEYLGGGVRSARVPCGQASCVDGTWPREASPPLFTCLQFGRHSCAIS
jgi:hypothetical protein